MNKKMSVVALAVMATSHVVYATSEIESWFSSNFTQVSASDYKDYQVRFFVSSDSSSPSHASGTDCGGVLIAGQYILTLAECVGTYSDDYVDGVRQFPTYISSGSSNEIIVSQGVNIDQPRHEYTTTYSVVNLIDDSGTDFISEFKKEYEYVTSRYEYVNWTEEGLSDSDIRKNMSFDIALIKLGTAIPQLTQPKLSAIFNSDSNTFKITSPTTLTYQSWLQTNSNYSETRTFGSNYLYWQNATYIATTGGNGTIQNRYTPNVPDMGGNYCASGSLIYDEVSKEYIEQPNGCSYYSGGGVMLVEPSTSSSAEVYANIILGLPLRSDNTIYALSMHETDINGSYGTGGAFDALTLTWYMPYLKRAINAVAAPNSVNFESDDDSFETTLTIQNFTDSDETLAPFIQGDDSDQFVVSGCEVTLGSMESCELTVTYTGVSTNSESISGAENATVSSTVYLGNTTNTSFPISYADGDANSATRDSSGGGSFGIISLMGLAVFGLIRFRKVNV
ncbi:hypothetical protein [Vibrio ziniensis]|uniref:Peptidase S1 domain-containing protein n=1 Tax=Vibrio ziniensis TaxID=2711221 RepID=A0A6G7CIG1_9VIBR|nr:hypothetical protein [Vibrio ziniensis]QIH41836.1 hypothetical protein G5S32_07465 [Vibrio ziniensis]